MRNSAPGQPVPSSEKQEPTGPASWPPLFACPGRLTHLPFIEEVTTCPAPQAVSNNRFIRSNRKIRQDRDNRYRLPKRTTDTNGRTVFLRSHSRWENRAVSSEQEALPGTTQDKVEPGPVRPCRPETTLKEDNRGCQLAPTEIVIRTRTRVSIEKPWP